MAQSRNKQVKHWQICLKKNMTLDIKLNVAMYQRTKEKTPREDLPGMVF